MAARQSFNFTSKAKRKYGVDQRRRVVPSGKDQPFR